jgi:hypothetical protein
VFGFAGYQDAARRRIRTQCTAARTALGRARRAHRRGRHSGTAEDMLAIIAVAEARLTFLDGQARLIERGDRQAILRQVDPAAYTARTRPVRDLQGAA